MTAPISVGLLLTHFSNLRDYLECCSIIARGYMFKNSAEPQIDYARQALQAWCRIPDNKKSSLKEDWQHKTDFKDLHDDFPELVDECGRGWFYRHVNNVADFIQANPDKVLQFQVSLFASNTKGAWILRFDDILAGALELGALRNKEVAFTAADKLWRL